MHLTWHNNKEEEVGDKESDWTETVEDERFFRV